MIKYFIIAIILIGINYKIDLTRTNNFINQFLNFSGEKKIEIYYTDFIQEELEKSKILFEQYKDRLNLQKTINLNYEIAEVLYFDNYKKNLIFVINKGTNNNIKVNQGVIAIIDDKATVVGKVIKTHLNTSKILTVYSPNFLISSRIKNSKTTNSFIMSGRYNEMKIKYFPYQYEFNLEDIIITTGNDGIFLPEYKIGKIKKVTPLEPEPIVLVQPKVNYKNLEWVIVLN